MFGRDLAIVLRAPLTWLIAAGAALLVGHGFVWAVDVYSASSRSIGSSMHMAREFDPLLGIIRPTIAGLNLALSLFGALMSARSLAIEKDRRTFFSAVLESGSVLRFVASKWSASLAAMLLPCAAFVVCLITWHVVGGHLALGETLLAGAGELLYAALVCAIGVASAAFCATLPQAAMVALLCVAAAWAVNASEGFSAFAWLAGAAAWSPSTYLAPFDQGTLQLDCASWYAAAIAGVLALAYVGCRFELHGATKALCTALASAALVAGCTLAHAVPGAWDVSEGGRHSLPPVAASALAELPGHLRIAVRLDREDSRRRQLETEMLSKLRLARPELELRFPTDDRPAPPAFPGSDDYGTLTIALGERSTETTSTSRRELTKLIFALASRVPPEWTQPAYRGYPRVIEGVRRETVLACAYVLSPLTFLIVGLWLTRARRYG